MITLMLHISKMLLFVLYESIIILINFYIKNVINHIKMQFCLTFAFHIQMDNVQIFMILSDLPIPQTFYYFLFYFLKFKFKFWSGHIYNFNNILRMSDLESTLKSLTQIVGSLQKLIANQNIQHNTLEPQTKMFKKTQDMTYNEFLHKVLTNLKPLQITSKKASYRLQQDVQLLLELSNHKNISLKTFEEISGKNINRSAQSLKSRYHDYLHKINEKDMKKIVNWIERQGVAGFLIFDGNDLKIQSADPKQNKELKRSRAASVEKQPQKYQKNPRLKNIPTNCKELNQVLKLYSKMVNIPVQTLTEKLDQLSGDIVELDNYVQTKDARMLWTSEEDEILRKEGSELQILRRYRGQGIEKRKKYLGI